MTLYESLALFLGAALLLAALYSVRSLRIVSNKISQLHAALKRNEKETSKQIQDLIGNVQSLATLTLYPTKRDRSKLKYVLSFTSYPARFSALEELIPSISNQILTPAEIHLNIAKNDLSQMSKELRTSLRKAGIKVFEVNDIGPRKKLIPTLSRTNLPIICIDDYLVLPPDLTLQLMSLHQRYPNDIIASRTHRVTVDTQGSPKKFGDWQLEFDTNSNPEPRLLATSGAGTLFPKGSLHPDVSNEQVYRELAFHTDDLWWYFQARRQGTNVRRIPGRRSLAFIEGSQELGLWSTGNQERNDQNFAKVLAKYGNPLDKSKLR